MVSSQKTTSLLWGGVGIITPIRTFIIGDETTYREHDTITYLDDEATQIAKIIFKETDDYKPIKSKHIYVKFFVPKRTDVTTNYTVACFPFGVVSVDEDGFASGNTGYKLVNHSGTANPTNDVYSSCKTKFTDDNRYVFGNSESFVSTPDAYSTSRGWQNNPALLDKDEWGRLIMKNKCNAVQFYIGTSGVFFPNGTKVEIFSWED